MFGERVGSVSRRRRLLGWGVAVAVVGLVVAGCSGESGPPAGPVVTASGMGEPIPETTPPLPVPVAPPVAAERTLPGAEAMVEHFLRLYTYAFAANDERPVTEASTPECAFCASAVKQVRENLSKGVHVEGGVVSTRGDTSVWIQKNQQATVSLRVDRAASSVIREDGTVVTRTRPERQILTVSVTWTSTGWKITRLFLGS